MQPAYNRTEYWKWIKQIWQKPIDANLRLVFADWLQDHGNEKAAKSQRIYAELIRNAYVIWCQFMQNPQVKTGRAYKQIFGYIEHAKQQYIKQFEIKKDGRIIFCPKYMGINVGTVRHVLKGKFDNRTPASTRVSRGKLKVSKKQSQYQRLKNHWFGQLYGTQPNSQNIPKHKDEGSVGIFPAIAPMMMNGILNADLGKNPCAEIPLPIPAKETQAEDRIIRFKKSDIWGHQMAPEAQEELNKQMKPSSVEKELLEKLIRLRKEELERQAVSFIVDTKEGWENALITTLQEKESIIQGTIDAIKNGKLFDYKTIRPSGTPINKDKT